VTTLNFSREAAAVRTELAAAGTPARAEKEKRYLKSELTFLGSGLPAVRAAAAAFLERWPAIGRAQLCAFVRSLWQGNLHEMRCFGLALLEKRTALLAAADLPLLEELLRGSRSWVYVDWLANKVVSPLVTSFPKLKKDLRRWAQDNDFWLRRAALLSLLPAIKQGETASIELFEELAVPMLGEQEFFIQKAIGTVLREGGKKQPDFLAAFTGRHRAAMAPITLREATRHTR
jgi:3-methyladenine DNA glycosylase AlkD